MISKIDLPDDLKNMLELYFEQTINNISSYTYNKKVSVINGNKLDENLPGVSNEYILKKYLSEEYKNTSLETNKFSDITSISFPPMHISNKLIDFLEEYLNLKLIYPSGNFYYPINGFMGWHTNSNAPGIRIYIAYSPIEMGSCFKYLNRNGDAVVTDWDCKGITVRKFIIPEKSEGLFWHCVDAPNSDRISLGYKF